MDIDLDEVLDIEDDIQRKIFVRVSKSEYKTYFKDLFILENADRLKVIKGDYQCKMFCRK